MAPPSVSPLCGESRISLPSLDFFSPFWCLREPPPLVDLVLVVLVEARPELLE